MTSSSSRAENSREAGQQPAIIGIGCRLGSALNAVSFWQQQLSQSAVSAIEEPGDVFRAALDAAAESLRDAAVTANKLSLFVVCAGFIFDVSAWQKSFSRESGYSFANCSEHASLPDGLNAVSTGIAGATVETALVVVVAAKNGAPHVAAATIVGMEQAISGNHRIYCTLCDAPSSEDLLREIGLLSCSESAELPQWEQGARKDRSTIVLDRSESDDLSDVTTLFLRSVLALYHRVLPRTNAPSRLPAPWQTNESKKSWIHPKTHPKVPQEVRDGLKFKANPPRRAAVRLLNEGQLRDIVLEEYDDPAEMRRNTLLQDWGPELCVLSGESAAHLSEQLHGLRQYLFAHPHVALKDVAASLARVSGAGLRMAIVANSPADLLEKVESALQLIAAPHKVGVPNGLYFGNQDSVRSGRTAFILPGLGAAYPNMLADLSMHFPDVRAAFDFVDELALSAGETSRPSRLIFPSHGATSNAATTALLASMDSAVVTVLMAEWALFTVLSNLGIRADMLIGCSTGEFAALAMSDAVDVVAAAPMFYRLSTTVARSVSRESLANLRSLRIARDYDEITPLLEHLSDVYLGADLSPMQNLISGSRESMTILAKRLDAAGIEFHPLPIAIPYHTPLVAGFVSTDNPELQELPLSPPAVPAWSCARAAPYPNNIEEIHRLTTDLFTRPIRFKETIRAAYNCGVTKFIEVGPKDTLTPIVGEILGDLPHLAVASNVATGSALAHLHHMLAALYCADVELNLEYLFDRRCPQTLNIFTSEDVRPQPWVELQPDLSYGMLQEIDPTEYAAAVADSDPAVEMIIGNYLDGLATFHGQMMQVNADVMAAYLQNGQTSELANFSPNSNVSSQTSIGDLPFVQRGIITSQSAEGALELSLNLTLNEHRYLLDHAIGGPTSASGERVYLLPLTVALEIMAEVASLLMPGLRVSSLQNIRAAKKVRVGTFGCPIRVTATIDLKRQNLIVAELHSASGHETATDSAPMMSCEVIFAHRYQTQGAVPPAPIASDGKKSSLSKLYGQGGMFHGETMQSIDAIDSVGDRSISAGARIRSAHGWFATDSAPRFLCDPLLLDNATQAVLFYLYENKVDVSALLPFFVDSIEFFDDLGSRQNQCARINVKLRHVNSTGTESDIAIQSEDGTMLASFNRLSHRSIMLPDAWQQVVTNPSQELLSQNLPAIAAVLPQSSLWSVASMEEGLLPIDDVALSWCTDYFLSEEEQLFFGRLPNIQRRREWLIGRISVKDAIRRLAQNCDNALFFPADIEIEQASDGKPFVSARTSRRLGWQPVISISHKDGVSVAMAGHPSAAPGAGIDIETITSREEGFERLAFTEQEQNALATVYGDDRLKLSAQLWCAKEAVGKALGSGLSGNPRSIVVTPNNIGSSHTMIARQASEPSHRGFLVHCLSAAEPNKVLAITALEPA